jgi:hypothetical protein
MTPSLQAPLAPGLQGLVDRSKNDLAQRLSIPTDEIVLLETASVTWPDSSLGCPQEGMAYAQVLIHGYLIRLQVGNTEYEYHAGKSSTIIYCQNPVHPVPGMPGDT